MKDDEQFSAVSEYISEIERVIGRDLARRFVAVFAGTSVTFAKTKAGRDFDRIVRAVGQSAANRLCDRFAREKPYIARGVISERRERHDEIRARRQSGETAKSLARAFGIAEGSIRRICKSAASDEEKSPAACSDQAT